MPCENRLKIVFQKNGEREKIAILINKNHFIGLFFLFYCSRKGRREDTTKKRVEGKDRNMDGITISWLGLLKRQHTARTQTAPRE